MHTETIRNLLPPKQRGAFDDITSQRVLGASRHIEMIGEMFTAIAKAAADSETACQSIADAAAYFKETRGQASQAVTNAINLMTSGLSGVIHKPIEEARAWIEGKRQDYFAGALRDLEKIVEYGAEVAADMDCIMVFDYSSTVNAFLRRIGKRPLVVYIPESRCIDGGRAFVKTCLTAGHQVHFIPDAAMLFALKRCRAVFIGAETFYPDGTVFNTTGSDILARLCRDLRVPYYVLTPMLKVDTRAVYGRQKDPVVNDLAEGLAKRWTDAEKDGVDFSCPELLGVEPEFVTAFITEQGVIPSRAMFSPAMAYARNMLKGSDRNDAR